MSEGSVQRDLASPASGRVFLFVVLAVAVLGFLAVRNSRGIFGDEDVAYRQMKRFLAGSRSVDDKLAVSPAYHLSIALPGRLFHLESLNHLRLISLLFNLPAVALFYAACRRLYPEMAVVRGYQYLFLPILLPYCFLLYTDPFALLFLLLAVYFTLRGMNVCSGSAGIASAVVRQNFAVWLGFLFIWNYYRTEGSSVSKQALARHLLRNWTLLLGLAGLAVFVVLVGGLTLGQHQHIHPAGRVYLGNVWFTLVLCWILLLPLHLANLRPMIQLVQRFPLRCTGGLCALALVYWLSFNNSHENNLIYPDYLHNQLLGFIFHNDWTKACFFLPIAWTLLSLGVTPLQKGTAWALYSFWVLSLVPVWMIEQRYSMPGFVLFLLLRLPANAGLEAGIAAYFAMWSCILMGGMAQRWFFL